MTKYTAKDFANARFAEHGKEDDPAFRSPNGGKLPWKCACGGAWSDEAMADMDWVPVTPARTITDSEVENLCGDMFDNDTYLMGFIDGFESAGGTIADDPAPTEAQKIEQLLWQINSEYSSVTLHGAEAVKGWAHQLAKHGVRVEEGK